MVGLARAVDRNHDRSLGEVTLGLLDNQGIDLAAAQRSAADATDAAAVDRADADGPDHQQVVIAAVHLVDERAVILAFQRNAVEADIVLPAALLDLVQVGIGDNRQAAGDQFVVHLALMFEFLLYPVLLGQATFHLAKAQIVHFRGIRVGPGNPAAPVGRQIYRFADRLVGMIRGIHCDQYRTIGR